MIKKYTQFINEADIQDIFDAGYLRKLEVDELKSLGLTPGDKNQLGQIGSELRSGVIKCKELISKEEGMLSKEGKSISVNKELEKLAQKVIQIIYGGLIERYDIDLNMRIITPDEVKEFYTKKRRVETSEDFQMNLQKFNEIKDENLKDDIYRRKIANLIIQGKAKGIKEILDNPIILEGSGEVKGLNEIMPNYGKEILSIWKNLSIASHKRDLLTDPEVEYKLMAKDLITGGGGDFAGASYVSWKPKDTDDESGEFTGDESEEDMFYMEMEESPVLNAVGIDFSMLLHETVKSLYEFLAVPSISDDEETAATVRMNTGLADEPQDWKYGRMIARDLESFVRLSPRINELPNLFEEFCRDLLDKNITPREKFLPLVKGILEKTQEARQIVDEMIDNIIYDLTPQSEEETIQPEDSNESEISRLQNKESDLMNQINQAAMDPSKFSKSQLQDLERKAAEFEEYGKAAKIRDYLNK